MDEDVYRQYILSAFNNLKNKRDIEDPTFSLQGYNASCGDRLTVQVKVDEHKVVTDMAFQGDGCLLSQVSAEILSEEMKGKKLDEVSSLDLNTLLDIVGIHPNPSRMKCMELSLMTAKKIAVSADEE